MPLQNLIRQNQLSNPALSLFRSALHIFFFFFLEERGQQPSGLSGAMIGGGVENKQRWVVSRITKIPPGVTIVTVPRTVLIYSGMPRSALKKQLQPDVWVPKFSHATSLSSTLHIFIDLSMHTSCTEICKAITIRTHIL